MGAESDTKDMADTNAVALKLPTFWTQQPRVWFAQAESQFAIRKIVSEETRYHYVVAALNQETATHVLDLLETIKKKNHTWL